ncbi:DUF2249 domain-containing protein [Cryobacterium sp. Y11]|jgi:uncharacterized protein (DUF2249 family)|uniref:DUF2249 domain-containing protein n=1 Tax=Cryobacterium sp. Y11 TaxID=2045016 RepID=UPI000CE3AAE7|nr:DUF2249 domain-containing protein [Cryobacterium sp. Y11]
MTAEPITIAAGPSAHEHASTAENAAATCNCGHDASEAIVLDSRTIPHAVRHAAIFGALDAIQPGISLDLVASHNPLPLLATLQRNQPDAFTISYLQEGPEVWTLRLTRNA